RDLFVHQPAVLYVYLRHPVASPSSLARMETTIDVLRLAGFTEGAAQRAYAALQTFTIGFAALEASREGWHPAEDEVGPVGRRLAAFTTPQQFADGLGFLLEGLERHRQEGVDGDRLT
ncbi:MAG: TetR/AcrR family transcriptional regulator C-terminal domain-containing protein, partial [Streptosporangiaceae bacterium]